MDFTEILNNAALRELLLALLASAALITFFNDAIAHLVARIPVVGGLLAMLVRRLTPHFWTWLEEQVRSSAERAVRAADARAPDATGATRAVIAQGELAKAQPGLTSGQLEREVQAAFDRVVADHERATKTALDRGVMKAAA